MLYVRPARVTRTAQNNTRNIKNSLRQAGVGSRAEFIGGGKWMDDRADGEAYIMPIFRHYG